MCAIAQTGRPTRRMLDLLPRLRCRLSGPQVFIGTHWLQQVDWPEGSVRVLITRAQLLASSIYDAKSPVHRDYEHRLHEADDRTGHRG